MYSLRFAIASTQRYGSSIMRQLFETCRDLPIRQRLDPVLRDDLDDRKNLGVAIDPAGRRIRLRRSVERAQGDRDRVVFGQVLQRLFSPVVFVIEDPAHRGRTGTGRGVLRHLELRPHRVVKIKARLSLTGKIVGGENRHDDADSLHDESKIIPQQLRERPHFAIHTHFLELGPAKKLQANARARVPSPMPLPARLRSP